MVYYESSRILCTCIFYLKVVKYNKSNEDFARTTERNLHGFVMLFSFCTSVFYFILGLYNNSPHGNMCVVIESPYGCHKNPDVECKRGEYASNLVLFLTFIPLVCICFGIQYNLGSLYLFVKADGDRQQIRFTLSLWQSQSTKLTTRIGEDNDPSTQQQRENEDIENIISRIRRGSSTLRSSTRNTTPGTNAPVYVKRAERRAKAVQQQTLQQALLYVGSYLAVYMMPLIMNFVWYRQGTDHPLAFSIVAHSVLPLQGVMNIYIYTRLTVVAVRKRHPEILWHRAFWW